MWPPWISVPTRGRGEKICSLCHFRVCEILLRQGPCAYVEENGQKKLAEVLFGRKVPQYVLKLWILQNWYP